MGQSYISRFSIEAKIILGGDPQLKQRLRRMMEAWSCVTIISQYTAWKCDMKWKHLFRLKIDDDLWPLEKNKSKRTNWMINSHPVWMPPNVDFEIDSLVSYNNN